MRSPEFSPTRNAFHFSEGPGLFSAGGLLGLVFTGAAVGLAALAIGGCDGSATQTTNPPNLQGTLVDVEGNPVPGVRIQVWPSNHAHGQGSQNSEPAATAQTDAQGLYAISDLQSGEYNLFGATEQGASAILIPRIRYLAQELDLGTDTLMPPGAIQGLVMANGQPLPGVLCYLPGSAKAVSSDSLGRFFLDQIPAGEYDVHYAKLNYSTVADIGVRVNSNDTTLLPTQSLTLDQSLPPSTPTGLVGTVDTTAQRITLTWNPVPDFDLDGYEVVLTFKPEDSTQDAMVIYKVAKTDTSFSYVYSGILFDGIYSHWPTSDSGNLHFRVRAIDHYGNQSRDQSLPIQMAMHRLPIQRTTLRLYEGEGEGLSPRCVDTLKFNAVFQFDEAFNSVELNWAQIHYSIVGWYPGESQPKAVWEDKDTEMRIEMSRSLEWYLGRAGISPIDTAAWLNGGNIDLMVDPRTPDSLGVKVQSIVGIKDIQYPLIRKMLKIKIDQQGCYTIEPSRNMSHEDEQEFLH
jgi:hypothetical protein